jgi:hypothetical protein
MQTLVAEFIGTALLVLLGDGVVANVVLNRTKGQNSGWIVITVGWPAMRVAQDADDHGVKRKDVKRKVEVCDIVATTRVTPLRFTSLRFTPIFRTA